MANASQELPGSSRFRRFAGEVRNAELPDHRLWLLYPIVGVALVALVIFHSVAGTHATSPHHPAASRTSAVSRHPHLSSYVALPTEQGATLSVHRAALNAIDSAVGASPGSTAIEAVVVTHAVDGRSLTCVVTATNAQGQATQRFITVVEDAQGRWASTGA